MDSLFTHFAPAARAELEFLQADRDLVAAQSVLVGFLHTVSSQLVVVNSERQVVYASPDFLKSRSLTDLAPVLGKRLGEVFSCLRSSESAGGCGTTEGCSVCGAIGALLDSQKLQARVTRECRMRVRDPNGDRSLDLEVTATPWDLNGRTFNVLVVRDTSLEQRRLALEKIFFHDIVNTVGGLSGILGLLTDYPDLNLAKELIDISQRSSHDLLEEILSFRQLKMAEEGELTADFATLPVRTILEETAGRVRYHSVSLEKTILTILPPNEAEVMTDRLLLERVLVNMLKNALEASPPGAEVQLGYRTEDGDHVFWVSNPVEMPRDVQLQVFQRSFSTKGRDRGLGTHGMKLIGERYLGGQVAFTSGEGRTEFTLRLGPRN